MTPLQQAAAALMDAMVQTDFTCRLGEQLDALEKALADEQAQPANSRIASLYEELRKATDGGSESMTHDDALKQIAYWQDKEQAPGEPAAWTLTATLDKRVTTTSGHLWFSNPVNCCWTPLYTRPAPPAPTTRPLTPAEKSELLEAGVTGECVRVLAFNDRPATGERAELITKLRENHSKRFVISPSIFSKAADMLEADAQELAALHRNRHAREDVISGLKDEIEAQQVAVPVPMSGYEISKWWASENGLEDCNMYIHGDFEKVVRAIEARHRIGTAP